MIPVHWPDLAPYEARYASPPDVPFRVTLTLRPGAALANYDPLNLDNLLARCVVQEATGTGWLPAEPAGYVLPVPLCCLWRDSRGLPLWACTPFAPEGATAEDVWYWHKRQQPGRLTKTPKGGLFNPDSGGRWMERRVPMPTLLAERWTADGLGDPHEVAHLLGGLRHVGKRRAAGNGEVESWRVEALAEFSPLADGRLRRTWPALAVGLLGGCVPEGQPGPVGWTPPQWHPGLQLPGWWVGTPVAEPERDWYAEAERL